eukprot:7578561-Alexandrium_andersonii.AAC.1
MEDGWKTFSALTAAYPEELCAAWAQLLHQNLRAVRKQAAAPLTAAVYSLDPELVAEGEAVLKEQVAECEFFADSLREDQELPGGSEL